MEGVEAGCHVNTDDVASEWFVFGVESERISQRGRNFPKPVSHSASRQMFCPVGVELVEDG